MVRTAVVFALIFVLNFLQIESELSEAPAAVQFVHVGSSVKFKCLTKNKLYPPSWTHLAIGSLNPGDVYLTVSGPNNEPLGRMNEPYYNRGFRIIENRETGEYSLEIQSVKAEDAGQYTCQARGGLGEKGLAQLTVIESSPECASNVTEEALGSNSCGKDLDMIALTCTFGVRGNSLPHVMWVKTGYPNSVVKVGPAQWTERPGLARSEYVVKAVRKDLTESSFTCIVQTSDYVENATRLTCDTPKINVLEIANTTDYRTVLSPEEVQCDPPSFKNSIGCKWVRRDESDAVVSEGQQLNLYRPEMIPGIYVCIVDCRIRGEFCRFEALGIKYTGVNNQETGPSSIPQDTSVKIAVVVVAVFAIACVVVAIAVIVRRKKSSQHHRNNLGENRGERVQGTGETINLIATQNVGERGQGADRTPIPNGGDTIVTVGRDERDSIREVIPGSREARLKALEEKAALRMRKNAVLRAQENPGFSAQDEDGDVAEGIPKSPSEKDE